MSIVKRTYLAGVAALMVASTSQAAWSETGWVRFDVRMDNGQTYIYPKTPEGSLSYNLGGSCMYNRLSLDNSGDYFGSVENGKRMYSMLLTAKATGLRVSLGFENASGPVCKLAQLYVEWPN